MRRVGNVTLLLKGEVWTDANFKKDGPVLRVKPYSEAYFKLIETIPELRETFSFSERLIVSGRSMAIELTAQGKEQLGDADLRQLRERW
jgi:hypothetical protein